MRRNPGDRFCNGFIENGSYDNVTELKQFGIPDWKSLMAIFRFGSAGDPSLLPMNRIKIILLMVLSATVGAIVIQNRASVRVQLLFTDFELSLILLLALAVLAGFVLGLLVAALSKSPPAN